MLVSFGTTPTVFRDHAEESPGTICSTGNQTEVAAMPYYFSDLSRYFQETRFQSDFYDCFSDSSFIHADLVFTITYFSNFIVLFTLSLVSSKFKLLIQHFSSFFPHILAVPNVYYQVVFSSFYLQYAIFHSIFLYLLTGLYFFSLQQNSCSSTDKTIKSHTLSNMTSVGKFFGATKNTFKKIF